MVKQMCWNPEQYAATAPFNVTEAGRILSLLSARPGERILDLGCGDGVLTQQLVALGCEVVGVDASEAQVAAARARGLDARVGDGHDLKFEHEFDAVFSNAAMHWLLEPDAAIASVARALRPGGRFVAELGGHGCVAAVRVAIASVLEQAGIDPSAVDPWYFPTDREYAQRLRRAGFTVTHIELVPRPTPLPTGIEGWLATFAKVHVAALAEAERATALARIAARLRPVLYDPNTGWTADYVRLRVVASLPVLD